MRKPAPKGSVPVVCWHKVTKSYIAMDDNHPLMKEDYIEIVGSIADYDMNGKLRNAPDPEVLPKPVTAEEEVEEFLADATVIKVETPEVEEEEVPELSYTDLKKALTEMGIQFRGNAPKAELAILYDEALHPIEE